MMEPNKRMLKSMLIIYNILLILIIFFVFVKKDIIAANNVMLNYVIKTLLLVAVIVLISKIPKVERLMQNSHQKDNKKYLKNLQLIRIENPYLIGFFFGLGFFTAMVIVYFILISFSLV